MAIDHRLYEKYSGRTGDPQKRLGEALSQSAAQRQATDAAKDKSITQRHFEAKFKLRAAMVIIGVVILAAMGLWRMIAG
jgi:hypothetical protein